MAELVKRQDRWDLYGEDGSKKASSAPNPMGKLSIENCKLIENGYDLDELIESNFKGLRDCINDTDISEFYIKLVKTTVRELIGDKSFSKKDMYDAVMLGVAFESDGIKGVETYSELKELSIKRCLQNTWEVEIVTKPYTEVREGFNLTYKTEPKLDADGCLILKRK